MSREIEPIAGARLKAIFDAKGWEEIVVTPPDPGIWIMREGPPNPGRPGKIPFPIEKRVAISVAIIRDAIRELGITVEEYFTLVDATP